MAKRRRQTDSDGTTPTATTYNTIFIDTNIDTHIAMIVSDSDTVSILKEKIVSEHALCFPETGEIKIHSLKVKRKGYLYRLPDYMLVKSAFEGAKKSWFLHVDISSLKLHNNMQKLMKPDVSNQKALVCSENSPQGNGHQDLLPDELFKTPSPPHESVNGKVQNANDARPVDFTEDFSKDNAVKVGCNADAHSNDLSSDTSRSSALRVHKSDMIFENRTVSETVPAFKDDKSRDDVRNNRSFSSTRQSLAEKRKTRPDAIVACSATKGNNDSVHASRPETVTTGNEEDKKFAGSYFEFEQVKDDHRESSIIGKKKRKSMEDSVHHDQAEASALPSTHVVKVNRSSEKNAAINSNGLHNSSYAAVGSKKNVQHEVLSEPSELSQNQMQHDRYQNMGKQSSLLSLSKGQNSIQDVPTIEPGNGIEHGHLDEANKHTENVGNNNKIVKKKKKKVQSSTKNIIGSLPINDPKVDQEITTLNDRLEEVNTPFREQGKEKGHMQLSQTNTSCQNTENVEGKSRKKTKRNQGHAADRHSSLPMKDPVAVEYVGDVTASTARLEEADTSYKAPESSVHVPLALDSSDKAQECAGITSKKAKNASEIQGSPPDSHSNLPIKDQGVVDSIHRLRQPDNPSKTRNRGNDRLKEVNTPSKKQGEVKACTNTSQDTEKKERKSRKKIKMNQSSGTNGHSSLPAKDQVAVGYVGDTAASDDRLEEAGTSYKAPESLDHVPVVLNPTNNAQEHHGITPKKAKKAAGNQGSAANSLSNVPIKDQRVVEGTAASIHRSRELDSSSTTIRTTGKHQQNQLAVSELKYQKSSFENNNEGPELNTCNLSEVARCEEEEINFKQYFVPGQHQSEVVTRLTREAVAEKKVEENGVPSVGTPELQQDMLKSCNDQGSITSAPELKNNTKSSKGTKIKKMDKLDGPHAPVSSKLKQIKTLQKPIATAVSNASDTNKSLHAHPAHVKKNDKTSLGGSTSSSSSGSSGRIPLKKRVKKESGLRRHPLTSERTSIKLSGKVSDSLKREKSLLRTPGSIFKDVSDERGGSSSSSESSGRIPLKKRDKKESGLRRHPVTSERTSTKLSGKVSNSLIREKSLLRTPGSIFKDVSDESSGDENGLVDSEASTRTPSDNSSSSGYSSDGSDRGENSMKNGANGVDRKGGRTKRILKPDLSGPKQIPMDMIFKSSSRFKKAKLTASQQFEETETQPIDFVL